MKFKTTVETDFWKSVFYETFNQLIITEPHNAVASSIKNADSALEAFRNRINL